MFETFNWREWKYGQTKGRISNIILVLTYTIQILMLNFLTPFQSLAVVVPEKSDRNFMGVKTKMTKY